MPTIYGRSSWSRQFAYFRKSAVNTAWSKIFGQIMTSLELLLALADEETLELARRMIGKPGLALLLAKAAIGNEGGAALDADAVAEILGVHKRHAYRLKKNKTCQMEKRVTVESQNDHKRFVGESQNGTVA